MNVRVLQWLRQALGAFFGLSLLLPAAPALAGFPFWVEKVDSSQFYGMDFLNRFGFVYSDREFVFTKLPDCLENRGYVVTANSDKFSTGDSFLLIRSDAPVDVFVGFDTRYATKPDWLTRNFRELRFELEAGDPKRGAAQITLRLHHASFDAGTIELGGNLPAGTKSNYAMYTVIVVERSENACNL